MNAPRNYRETPVFFDCQQQQLLGIICQPAQQSAKQAVCIITGGPQYRAGSHRQFTLLARHLAAQGIASLRFDARGMGDSQGSHPGFSHIAHDIAAAIDCLVQHSKTPQITLWGLCDAASAALIYCNTRDPRVKRLILVNPWVRAPQSAAQTQLKHYYLKRLTQADFWKKLIRGGINLKKSGSELGNTLQASQQADSSQPFISRMLNGLQQFNGAILFILSGNDQVSQEFQSRITDDSDWQQACQRPTIQIQHHPEADHTFSCGAWRSALETGCSQWLTGE